jgi:hypothetical protein
MVQPHKQLLHQLFKFKSNNTQPQLIFITPCWQKNLTQHDSHRPDDHPKTSIDYHRIWTCQKMMVLMSMELIDTVGVIW